MMSTDEVYSILYRDGKCNYSPEILQILESIVLKNSNHTSINGISRWNIYMPSSIHIVFSVLKSDRYKTMVRGGVLNSDQVICQISDFEREYRQYNRDKQLNELGI